MLLEIFIYFKENFNFINFFLINLIFLDLEGFKYSMENRCNGFSMVINRCPWYDLLVKSNRSHLAEKVGTCICNSEYAAFAREFGNNIGFTIREQLCAGIEKCVLDFQVITTL